MRVLVIGAGVLGSVYAARLQDAGYAVTLLARGARLEHIRRHGIVLQELESARRTVTHVRTTDTLLPEDAYDLAIVLVRKNQLAGVLPALAANPHIPAILFMVNNAAGPDELIRAVGPKRVLLGFPGGGGQRNDQVVLYWLSGYLGQPTTIGELDGSFSDRLAEIASVRRQSGFMVETRSNMDAWLKTHVALVSPIANAIYAAGGDVYRLANTPDALIWLVRAVREGLAVLSKLGIPIVPNRYRLLRYLPEPLLVAVLKRGFASRYAQVVLEAHAMAARDEMKLLADEFMALAARSGHPTPAINCLYEHIQAEKPMPGGRCRLQQRWIEIVPPLLVLSGLLLALTRFLRPSPKRLRQA